MKKLLKALFIFLVIIGIIYVAYSYFTKDDDFDEFDDDYDFDSDFEDESLTDKVKSKVKSVLP